MNWKPFFFDGNQFFDTISGPEDWQKLRNAYPAYNDAELLTAREATYKGTRPQAERDRHPKYGFRAENDGEKTLADFFKENGMTP